MDIELLKVILQIASIVLGLASPFVAVVVTLYVSRSVHAERLADLERRLEVVEERPDLAERMQRAERDIAEQSARNDRLGETLFKRLRRIELSQERIAAKLGVELPDAS